MTRYAGPWALLALLLLAVADLGPSAAAVQLRFDPPDQGIPLNGMGTLSIMLDDSLDVRTIETWAEFDPDILLSLGGGPGQLFTATGCLLFNDFDDEENPGEWYGASIILGFDCWLTGPGELYRWNFEGIAEGWTRVTPTQVRLYDPDAVLIDAVSLPFTYVFVGGGTDAPQSAPPLLMTLHPNPFNPQLELQVGGMEGSARLSVFDAAGRRLATVWEGELGSVSRSLSWRAEDARGQRLPSGVYLFRLESADGRTLTRRAVLLK